jgi:hypothetical protein
VHERHGCADSEHRVITQRLGRLNQDFCLLSAYHASGTAVNRVLLQRGVRGAGESHARRICVLRAPCHAKWPPQIAYFIRRRMTAATPAMTGATRQRLAVSSMSPFNENRAKIYLPWSWQPGRCLVRLRRREFVHDRVTGLGSARRQPQRRAWREEPRLRHHHRWQLHFGTSLLNGAKSTISASASGATRARLRRCKGGIWALEMPFRSRWEPTPFHDRMKEALLDLLLETLDWTLMPLE